MTSKTSAKFSTFFFFAVIGLFVVANPSTLKAQNNIDSLKGTEWAFVTPHPVNNMFLDCSFRFEDGGEVIKACVAYTEGRNELRTDYDILPGPGLINNPNYGGSKTVYIPPVFKKSEATGKYTIKGKTLIVEFSDTVENFTYCGKDDKDLLCPEKTNALPIPIHKISIVSKQNNSDIGKSTEASPNKATNSTSNNISLLLSLSEFQNSYYKPTPLTSNTISGTNPDHSTNSFNYSFIADSGVLTFNFVLKPSQNSYLSGILLFVMDRNNKTLVEKSLIAQRGRTEQASVSINVSEKQAMLLRMTVSGGGSHEIQLNGSLAATTNSADKNNDPTLFVRPPWDTLHSQAQTLMKNKQYDEAIKKYTQVLDITPPWVKMMFIYRERGMCKFELQDYEEAIADYNQAIKLYFDSDDSEILKVRGEKNNYILARLYFLRGNAREKLGEETSAYGDFRKSCKLDGSFREACAKLKTK